MAINCLPCYDNAVKAVEGRAEEIRHPQGVDPDGHLEDKQAKEKELGVT